MEDKKVGSVHDSNRYGKFKVISKDGRKCRIRFLETGYEKNADWFDLLKGSVRDPFYPVYWGVGFLGDSTRNHKFYSRWMSMMGRCYNPEDPQYPDYGGRGIKVAPAFHGLCGYVDYLEELAGYKGGDTDTVDRIDNSKGYIPGNLAWASRTEQNNNQRRRKDFKDFIATSPDGAEYKGFNQSKFAREHDLNAKGISACLTGRNKTHKGWKFRYEDRS